MHEILIRKAAEITKIGIFVTNSTRKTLTKLFLRMNFFRFLTLKNFNSCLKINSFSNNKARIIIFTELLFKTRLVNPYAPNQLKLPTLF